MKPLRIGKYWFEPKAYIRFILLTAAFAFCVCMSVRFGGVNGAPEGTARRYLGQAFSAGSVITAILLLRSIPRLLPDELREAIRKKLYSAAAAAFEAMSGAWRKLLGRMGLENRRGFAKGTDSFEIDIGPADKGRKKQKLSIGEVKRWKDLTDNSQKIRFIFIRFMQKKIRRGYRIGTGRTPYEWADDVATDTDRPLFGYYVRARYSGGRSRISDEELRQAKLISNEK